MGVIDGEKVVGEMNGDGNSVDLYDIGFYSIGALIKAIGDTSFYVAPYQRGYRWGETEINYLLNDIWQAADNRKYSLQPITVVSNTVEGEEVWELVDGQQRLTTIYLILTVLNKRLNKQLPSYSIRYNTRETTASFLQDIREHSLLEDWQETEESPVELWEDFTGKNPKRDNIDNFHLFQAYFLISKWFSLKGLEAAEKLAAKLLDNTNLIWYPIAKDGQSVEDRFININAGKIKLTDAELIKALFILKLQRNGDSWDIQQYKIKQLAEEWDTIEKQLHDDNFWYFINQKDTDSYQTRIGLLFDILSSSRKNQSSYDWFAEKEKRLVWDDLLNLYHRLTEWYSDLEVYHKVGFLINAGIKQLEDLVNEMKDIRKSEIKQKLDWYIREKMKSTKQRDGQRLPRFSFDYLSYEDDRNDCQIFLLLYNIKLLESTFPGQRFPFHLYRSESWSLEHIHPQNPNAIKSKEHAKVWLADFSERANELEGDQKQSFEETITRLQSGIENIDTANITQEIQDKLSEFTEKYKDDFDLHGILNLALLDKQTNSALSNLPFKEKRNSILKHENRRYIPLGTLNCFLKKASSKDHLQLEYWSLCDMEGYCDSIKSVLKEYLPDEKEA
jgi:uncharacterized protein with ParB-like and HNH nuclease domain